MLVKIGDQFKRSAEASITSVPASNSSVTRIWNAPLVSPTQVMTGGDGPMLQSYEQKHNFVAWLNFRANSRREDPTGSGLLCLRTFTKGYERMCQCWRFVDGYLTGGAT